MREGNVTLGPGEMFVVPRGALEVSDIEEWDIALQYGNRITRRAAGTSTHIANHTLALSNI